jgi:hypothetical protein
MKLLPSVNSLLLAVVASVAACMPCPGGIVVGPNSHPDAAMNAAVACDGQSQAAAASAPSSSSKTSHEMRAFNQCFEDRGFLTIPESVLLDKGDADKRSPSKDGALCPSCVKKQLAAHRE